ncbi:MAG: peptide chain release factor 2 [Deltaproteobacteria bacterium]|nr:peptide chain release factor 2 [Deltaproteobacteria bacterium]
MLAETRELLTGLVPRVQALGRHLDVERLARRIEELNARSTADGFWNDQAAAQKVLRERADAEQTLTTFRGIEREVNDAIEMLELAAAEKDEGVLAELAAQAPNLEARVRAVELARMLSGELDRSDCIVTIHPGLGGTDAQDWADILLRMYRRWCERHGFGAEMVDYQVADDAGIKGASFIVHGPYAYGYLRAEGGVHRLIRISPFDANARRQTAFAAVFVVPDLDDSIEIEIRDEDLQTDTFRAGGKGGQHVNKTESAVRITHVPTGIVVACQQERSQHKNRATAMKMLRGRLYEKARREREEQFEQSYNSGKLDAAFSSQIRTYTMAPYRLVKDERTGFKVGNVDAVLDGDLDGFIESFLLARASGPKRAADKPS